VLAAECQWLTITNGYLCLFANEACSVCVSVLVPVSCVVKCTAVFFAGMILATYDTQQAVPPGVHARVKYEFSLLAAASRNLAGTMTMITRKASATSATAAGTAAVGAAKTRTAAAAAAETAARNAAETGSVAGGCGALGCSDTDHAYLLPYCIATTQTVHVAVPL
jgi:hypothetical protein